MNNLKKRMSLILSIIMLALAIFPLTISTATTGNPDVEMSVKLNGKELEYKGTYDVKAGDKVVVKANSTTGSVIDKIGYYYYEDGIDTMVSTEDTDTITITIPTQEPGTKKALMIEAVGANNTGVEDPANRTGWQIYFLVWPSKAEVVNGEINAKYENTVLTPESTTTVEIGDIIKLYATPADRVTTLYYAWGNDPTMKVASSEYNLPIPKDFVEGETYKLQIRALYDNGEYSDQKNYYIKIGESTTPDEPIDPSDDELDVLPWEKENNELDSLAVALRNDSESKKKNKNIYALNEEVTYYVDYKNGGKDITDKVILKLELPLKFDVIDADGGSVDKSKGTITWTYNGMEEEQEGTKVVKIKYTGFDKKSTEYETIYPLATIAKDTKVVDESAVINLIYEDEDTVIDDVHTPYMYGDRDTPTFRPNDTITRAEGALVLTRILLGQRAIDNVTVKSVYPDLDETYEEAQKAIIAATSYGIINGYTDGYYRPNTTMTRAEFMKILAKFIEINAEDEGIDGLQIKPVDESVKIYKDLIPRYMVNGTTVTTHWAIEEVTLLTRLNMTGAKEDRDLRLDENITRAEVAQLVNFFSFRAPAEVSSRTTTKFTDVTRNHKLFGDIVEATRAAHEYSFTEDGTEIAE